MFWLLTHQTMEVSLYNVYNVGKPEDGTLSRLYICLMFYEQQYLWKGLYILQAAHWEDSPHPHGAHLCVLWKRETQTSLSGGTSHRRSAGAAPALSPPAFQRTWPAHHSCRCSGCKEGPCKWTSWRTPRAWCGPAFKHPIGHQDHTWTKARVSMDGCLRRAICHPQKSRAWAKVRQVGWEVFVGLGMAEQIGTYGTCKGGVA